MVRVRVPSSTLHRRDTRGYAAELGIDQVYHRAEPQTHQLAVLLLLIS